MRRSNVGLMLWLLIGCGGGSTATVPVAELLVTPAGPELDTLFSLGETVQLGVSARDANGGTIQNARIAFNSANTGVATVSESGLIQSTGNGSSIISITSGSVSATRTVRVRQRYVSLGMNPSTLSIVIGTTRPLLAVPRDALGAAISGLPAASYNSNDESIASISAAGQVTANALGNTTVSASLTTGDGTHAANADVNVVQNFPAAAVVSLGPNFFDPAEVEILAGGTVTFNNSSGVTHNVTFSGQGPGNIGNHASGQNERTFATPGTFPYQCTLHSGMTGTVIVY